MTAAAIVLLWCLSGVVGFVAMSTLSSDDSYPGDIPASIMMGPTILAAMVLVATAYLMVASTAKLSEMLHGKK